MVAAVGLQLLKWLRSVMAPQQDEAGFIDCDTSIPSVSGGMHSFPYIPCFVALRGGTLEGGKGMPAQITDSK